LEAWEKVFLGDAEFVSSTHGEIPCTICHLGNQAADDIDAAHTDMIADPSAAGLSCTGCHDSHADIAAANAYSQHSTLEGMKSALVARGGDITDSPLAEAFGNHCESCHTTCGSCHVSRPDGQGGGLVSDHVFKNPPSMLNNCNGCHAARVADEYLGNHEGLPGDLHWTKQGMTCADCHAGELHGDGTLSVDRYHSDTTVSCRDCHTDIDTATDNAQHNQHLDDFTCQSCHSVEYKSCFNCHVAKNDAGTPFFATDPSAMTFKIGLNPLQSDERPEKYAVLRHAPVAADTFAYYGDNLLPDFDSLPTWKYATPHNIQLQTPQNASCGACHSNPSFFLTEADVAPQERAANQPVIVVEPGP